MARAYVNARVYTMKNEGDTVEAFIIEDGKFFFCGSSDEAMRLIRAGRESGIWPDAEIVDLHGKCVLPGLIDDHQHVQTYARGLLKVDLTDARSIDEVKALVRAQAEKTAPGKLILGSGFDQTKFAEHRLPTRWDLDEAAPANPVVITRYCLHINIANSLALEKGGIFDKDDVPHGIERGENGKLTGCMQEREAAVLINTITDGVDLSDEELKDAVVEALHQLNSYGLTGVHPIQGKHCDLMEYTDIYQALKDEGRLTARIYINYDVLPGCNIRTGLGDEMLKFGFYKSYMDGNLSGRTAFMLEPYSDDPSTCGVCNYESQEAITEHLREGYQQGMQIGVHAIGDRAADMLITAIETIYREDPHPDPRFRLIHMTTLNASLVERMSKLPVIVDVQPVFIPINVRSADSRMGDTERGAYTFAYKKMMDAGLMLTGGSDSPCDSFNPLDGVYALVNRKDYTGYPEGGWHPQECIGVYDALRMYTYNAAYSSYEETIKGTIKEGKLADFVVLDADIFKVDPMKIKDIKVEKTYLGGKLVYSRD